MSITTQELRSLITPDGELRLTLEDVPVADPGPDEVVVRIDATPLNPSDVGELLGPADLTTLSTSGPADRPITTATIPPRLVARTARRAGKSLVFGNEGAGVVVAAGTNGQHLIGKVVGAMAGRMYTRYRTLTIEDLLVFPDGVSAKQAAAALRRQSNNAAARGKRVTIKTKQLRKTIGESDWLNSYEEALMETCKPFGGDYEGNEIALDGE